MKKIPRIYETLLARHLRDNRQMAFVSGPRQVGKTTLSQNLGDLYLNYDKGPHRLEILAGEEHLLAKLRACDPKGPLPVVVFDELHKMKKWKNYLKGFFDGNDEAMRVIVTGSSKLDAYRRAGDSLLGRYFNIRVHPLSVAELARTSLPSSPIQAPAAIADSEYRALWQHGGFPEPFVRRQAAYTETWHEQSREQMMREDVRDLSGVQVLSHLSTLALILQERSGSQVTAHSLAKIVQVSDHTVKKWMELLANLHWGFLLRPWQEKVSRAIQKEPKWYLRDWSCISDPGARAETFVACHLLKACEGWTDLGFGTHELYYVRDKEKREVDFLITKKRKPWLLVEVKSKDSHLSPALHHFHEVLGTEHALQLQTDAPYSPKNCLDSDRPKLASAQTFLSQLL